MGIQRTDHADAAHDILSFGALLRRHRLAAGLTQRELARRADMSLRAITGLENDERQTPRKRTVALLARALNLAPEEHAALVAARRAPARGRVLLLPTAPTLSVAPRTAPPIPQPTQLPTAPTPLLGRERELAEVTASLRGRRTRLLTLTGPGGVGKTSLALRAARNLLDAIDAFPDGVWFVSLAPLTDPTLVIPTIAQALGLREGGGRLYADRLRAHLRERSLLLLLDNFEHLAEAAQSLAQLLEWSAGLSLLVTSRAPLRLRAEQRFPVSLLALPPMSPSAPHTTAQLDGYAATALFLRRARAIEPAYPVNDATAPLVAAICARLDGLPLAIELAAARASLLAPAALLARLERQLPLLSDGAVDLPERQRTMRATISWSYQLMAAPEQRLFRRLAVFADGCALEAVEAVCAAPAEAPALGLETLEGLSKLADRSVIALNKDGAETRISVRRVVREFALEELERSGEAAALRRAHALYYRDFAERLEPKLRGPEGLQWIAAPERELDNVRAALGWACATGEAEEGLRLATALWRFWFEGGHLSEGQQWIEALLAVAATQGASLPTWLRARAAATAGVLSAARLDLGPAVVHLRDAVTLGRAADDWRARSMGLELLGGVARERGDTEQARRYFEEALAVGRACGDTLTIITPLASLGLIARIQNDLTKASAFYTEAKGIGQAAGHLDHAASMLERLGEIALSQGDDRRALRLLREAVAAYRASVRPWYPTTTLELLAVAYAQTGHEELAARLFGAATQLRETTRTPYVIFWHARIETLVAPVRAALSAGAWAAMFAAGRALTRAEACDEALAEMAEMAPTQGERTLAPTVQPGRGGAHRQGATLAGERLTQRELEVLRLLTQGWTDAHIAQQMVISPRTVNHHVAAIYAKLGVSSRVAATRAALERGLL